MKEALFILFVIALLLAFTAYKYRRQIRTIREFWRMTRMMREASSKKVEEFGGTGPESKPLGRLVNCAKCGTWVPEERSVRLGKTSVFCSARCLESASKPSRA